MKDVDLGEPTSFLDHVQFGVALKESVKFVRILWQTAEICSNPGFLLEEWKIALYRRSEANMSSWSCDMEGRAKKCVEKYCELAK